MFNVECSMLNESPDSTPHSTSNIQHLTFNIESFDASPFMEVLFTPWRYAYLTSPKSETPNGCIFCNAVKSKAMRETGILFRNGDALVMLNRYPYTNGHLMVAPVAHEALL